MIKALRINGALFLYVKVSFKPFRLLKSSLSFGCGLCLGGSLRVAVDGRKKGSIVRFFALVQKLEK